MDPAFSISTASATMLRISSCLARSSAAFASSCSAAIFAARSHGGKGLLLPCAQGSSSHTMCKRTSTRLFYLSPPVKKKGVKYPRLRLKLRENECE